MPAMSPKTQYAMGGAPSAQDAEAIYEEKFSELAHNFLTTKFPMLAERVQMFQTLNVDIENDVGVGTFVTDVGGEEVHVPVVAERGRMSPLDIMYVKKFDTFVPLTEEWLAYLEAEQSSNLGEDVKAPRTLSTDVDIRNLVVPPMTGRYSYASAPPMDLMDALTHAKNETKIGFIRRMRNNPKIAQHVLGRYGRARLSASVAPRYEKTAGLGKEEGVVFFDAGTPLETLKEAFASDTPRAFYEIKNKGYAVLDRRPDPKLAYDKEYLGKYTTSEDSGVYKISLRNGETRTAYVSSAPVRLTKNAPYARNASPKRRVPEPSERGKPVRTRDRNADHTVFIFTDKGELLNDQAMELPVVRMAENIATTEGDAMKVFPSSKLGEPKEGEGFFVGLQDGRIVVTEPIDIENVSLRSDGTHVLTGNARYGNRCIIRKGPDYVGRRILVSDADGYPEIRIPHSFRFVKVTSRLQPELVVTSIREAQQIKEASWAKSGADTLILRARYGSYGVDDRLFSDRVKVAEYLIKGRDLTARSAEDLIKMAELKTKSTAFVLGRPQFLKLAAGEMQMPEGGVDPSQMDPSMMDPSMMDPSMMDPSMMDPSMMDPSMMDPSMMMPPPPSPVEQAAMEVSSVLQSQTQELLKQMEQQSAMLQAQVQAINSVLGRAEQIAVGAPPLSPEEVMSLGVSPMDAYPVDPTVNGPAQPPIPQEPIPQVPDEMLEDSMAVDGMSPDANAFDTSAVAGLLAEGDDLDDLARNQLPKFRDALDAIAQTLLEMRIKGPSLKEEIGDKRYDDQINKLKRVLTALGSVLLSLYRNSRILEEPATRFSENPR